MVSGWIFFILILIFAFTLGGLIGLAYIIRSSKWNDEVFKYKLEWPGKILFGQNYKLSKFSPSIRGLWTWGCGLIFAIFIVMCIFAMWNFLHVFILE